MRCVATHEAGAVASSLAWHPEGNALAMALESGAVAVWEAPVPAGMTGPTADPESVPRGVAGEGGDEDEEDEEGVEDSGVDTDAGAAAASGFPIRLRLSNLRA